MSGKYQLRCVKTSLTTCGKVMKFLWHWSCFFSNYMKKIQDTNYQVLCVIISKVYWKPFHSLLLFKVDFPFVCLLPPWASLYHNSAHKKLSGSYTLVSSLTSKCYQHVFYTYTHCVVFKIIYGFFERFLSDRIDAYSKCSTESLRFLMSDNQTTAFFVAIQSCCS